jgi:hypothetical protein
MVNPQAGMGFLQGGRGDLVLPQAECRYTKGLAMLRQRMAEASRRSKVRAFKGETFDHVPVEIGGAARRP